MHQVSVAIIVPKRAWILEPCLRNYRDGLRPGPGDSGRRTHEDAFIRRWKIHVKPSIVLPDRRRPYSSGVAIPSHHVVLWAEIDLRQYVPDDRPMHQVLRLENRNTRHEFESRGDKIEVRSVANHIRIGIVGEEHGVLIAAGSRLPGSRLPGENGSGNHQ